MADKKEEELRDAMAEAQEKAVAAAEEHEAAINALDEHIADRTAQFKPEIVQEAYRIGINPSNFETDNDVQEAINRQLEENPELKPETNFKDQSE